MRTRTTLLTTSLLFATAVCFAQTKPTSTAPIVTAPPVATAPPSATVGQTITLSGTAYKVSTKKVLATGVEYYSMKATTPKAVTQYFLRTNNKYNATVFTQAQYEAFIKTGKLSSFGSLKKGVVGGRNMRYVTKGTTNVLFAANKGTLSMYEFVGSISTVMAAEQQQPQSPERTNCKLGCNAEYGTGSQCDKDFGPQDADSVDPCGQELFACWDRCDEAYKSPKPPVNHLVKPVTTIKFL